jgi:hypothetical protein
MVASLVIGTLSAIGIYAPAQRAMAQAGVTIETSADDHGDAFFGEGLLQVIIEDPTTDDTDPDTIDVTVRVESTSGDNDVSITVPNTSDGSQRFEFFVFHAASGVTPADPDTSAALGADQLVDFGTGATDLPVAGLDLYEDARIVIEYGSSADVNINYEESAADLSLDRDVYGSTSVVHVHVVDQDGNLDPTDRDSYVQTDADMDLLIVLLGAGWNGTVTFDETGDNTADFEAEVSLSNGTIANDEIVATDDSIQLTLNDMANYADPGFDNPENDSTDTSSESLTIDDNDGDLSPTGTVTFASELKMTITDNDQNLDSENDDTITDALIIETDGGDVETFDLAETGDTTGIFVPDASNDEIKITFLSDGVLAVDGNGIVELSPTDVTEDISVTYQDPLNSNSVVENFTQTFSVDLSTPQLSVPDEVGVNDDVIITITDANLNDNPRTKDTYAISLVGDPANGEHDLQRGGLPIGDWATLEVEIEGDHPDFGITGITETLVETGISTGVFTATIDMEDIVAATGADLSDGDSIKFTFHDYFDDQSHEASSELSIGKASTGVDFSRSVLPIPPAPTSDMVDVRGDETVFTTMVITDSDQNEQSNTEDQLMFQFEDDVALGEPSFRVEIDSTVNSDDETISSAADYAGSLLEEILPGLVEPALLGGSNLTLSETAKTSGVFDESLAFEFGTSLDTEDWQDLEVTFTYIDANGDEEKSGIRFRANDGTISTDQSSVRNGAIVVITVQDEDLNLDDDTAEEFTSSVGTADPYIVSVETEDDEIAGSTTETFRETGTDTGVFTASFEIGDQIPVTEDDGETVKQATNILITYNDEVDSSGSSGDEVEINVPVVTGTGALTVSPDLVGPGTTIKVLLTDLDLNQDASGTDDYTPADPSSDDFFISFRSDRTEVGRASPEIEETGANTGVFEFTIELITDESACQDDDLGDAKFDAEGGSTPSIGACPGDLISIRYEDEQDASGRSTTVSALVEVKSFDPEFAADKDSYAPGEKVTITISDPDANRDADIADSLKDIRITSDSDQVGNEISAIETGKDTGVFKLTFTTSTTTSSGTINVKQGDDVTITYTDDFPADFESEENDKDFDFSVSIGGAETGTGSTTPSKPVLQDVSGKPVTSPSAGQQLVLSTTVVNNVNDDLPFVALLEVRDINGVTISLAWQTGTLNANDRADIGVSWTPQDPGTYTLRTFVISDLANPRVLSLVQESTITVS